jgi:hypothetical protein
MVCPNCSSTDLRKVSLVHAAGIYESRGRFLGLLLGSMDGVLVGQYRGTSQSRLSRLLNPPRKLPYLAPIVLWLIGFFILMSFDARGKLSWVMAVFSVTYVLLLPAYLLGSLIYNLFIRPKKFKQWQQKFICQQCGAIVEDDRYMRSSSEQKGRELVDSGLPF